MNSTLIYGTDTIAELMKRETMEHEPFVSPNQKYSAYDNPKLGVHENDRLWLNGAASRNGDVYSNKSSKDAPEKRVKHAIGGVAKLRLGYPDTDKLPTQQGDND